MNQYNNSVYYEICCFILIRQLLECYNHTFHGRNKWYVWCTRGLYGNITSSITRTYAIIYYGKYCWLSVVVFLFFLGNRTLFCYLFLFILMFTLSNLLVKLCSVSVYFLVFLFMIAIEVFYSLFPFFSRLFLLKAL